MAYGGGGFYARALPSDSPQEKVVSFSVVLEAVANKSPNIALRNLISPKKNVLYREIYKKAIFCPLSQQISAYDPVNIMLEFKSEF